jgi:hypothetical protein
LRSDRIVSARKGRGQEEPAGKGAQFLQEMQRDAFAQGTDTMEARLQTKRHYQQKVHELEEGTFLKR